VTLEEFTKLVADMRHAQKEYFRTRSTAALEQSKRLERRVDEALTQSAAGQKELFAD
jgi:hypothetical protein